MLVCQCNAITEREIEAIVLSFLKEDPWQLVVPAKVYRAIEKHGRCAGCFPNVVDIIARVTEEYHLQLDRSSVDLVDVKARLTRLRQKRLGGRREGRSTGYRAA